MKNERQIERHYMKQVEHSSEKPHKHTIQNNNHNQRQQEKGNVQQWTEGRLSNAGSMKKKIRYKSKVQQQERQRARKDHTETRKNTTVIANNIQPSKHTRQNQRDIYTQIP